MAYQTYLVFDGEKLPLPDSYDLSLSNVEAESSGQTEAGTIQRDVIRSGVVKISAGYSVSAVWLTRLTYYSKLPKIVVQYFDTEDLSIKETEMYMSDYSVKLKKDTSYKSLWDVSFTLNEY